MRSILRTLDPDLLRKVAALAPAALLVGVSFGAIATAAGIPVWLSVVMSLLVFAGGAQFAAVAVVASGGGALFAAVAGILLNARHLPFGIAIGDVLGRRWLTRLVGSHLMIDESVAFALAEGDSRRRKVAYWACGVALFVSWNAGVLAGAVAGNRIGDPATFGLDAAFPAAMLALLLPAVRDRSTRTVAVVGAVLAVAATPVLPAGVPVLLAVAAVPIVALVRRSQPARSVPDREPGADPATGPEPGTDPATSSPEGACT
ncbi:MAG: AzlC family ABC transporter permease [Micromonosporaceae bacterium]